MSYSIIRIERATSKANSIGHQRHNQRENKNYSNKDIDLSKSYLNYDLINFEKINYLENIDKKINENKKSKRKVGENQVQHMYGVITSDSDFFNSMDEDQVKDFFKNSLEFIENRFGKENILYATVHMDETTPHMHFGFVPITKDGRLSARDVLNGRKQHSELQDAFNKHCKASGYDLQRGVSKEETRESHTKTLDYKKKLAYEVNKAKSIEKKYGKELDFYINRREELKNKISDKEKVFKRLSEINNSTIVDEEWDFSNGINKKKIVKMPFENYEKLIDLIVQVHDYYSIKEISPEKTFEGFKERLDGLYERVQMLRKMNLAKNKDDGLEL